MHQCSNFYLHFSKNSNKPNIKIVNGNGIITLGDNDLLYRKLSSCEEKHFIKAAKLAFYDEVSKEDQERYIEYFCDENPAFSEKLSLASTDEERADIIDKGIRESQVFRDKFIENNILLVMQYVYKSNSYTVSKEDLFQEGILGLMKALKKFDVERGFKFSTYAVQVIQQSIIRCIKGCGRTIRIPDHYWSFWSKVCSAEEELCMKVGKIPTNKEIADYLNISESKVEEIKSNFSQLTNLDEIVVSDDGYDDGYIETVGDLVIDETSEFGDSVDTELLKEQFRTLIANFDLSERNKKIIYMHYGFVDDKFYTYEELSKMFGVTHARIRQIDLLVLREFRRNAKIRRLVASMFNNEQFPGDVQKIK